MAATTSVKLDRKLFFTGYILTQTGISIGGTDTGLGAGGADRVVIRDPLTNQPYIPGSTLKGRMRSLLELGFAPSFLHISEATVKVRVAFSQTESTSHEVGGSVTATYGIFSATVNASYSAKYSFETQGSSEITTRIVSVPPPLVLSERLQGVIKNRN